MRLDAFPKPSNASRRILTGNQTPTFRPSSPWIRFQAWSVSSAEAARTSLSVKPDFASETPASAPCEKEYVVQRLFPDAFPRRVHRPAQRSPHRIPIGPRRCFRKCRWHHCGRLRAGSVQIRGNSQLVLNPCQGTEHVGHTMVDLGDETPCTGFDIAHPKLPEERSAREIERSPKKQIDGAVGVLAPNRAERSLAEVWLQRRPVSACHFAACRWVEVARTAGSAREAVRIEVPVEMKQHGEVKRPDPAVHQQADEVKRAETGIGHGRPPTIGPSACRA